MCGIVGVIAKKHWGFTNKEIDAFGNLLYVDALRGFDSTGVITVERDGSFAIDKEAVEATFFVDAFMKKSQQRNLLSNGIALIGHNRKSTVGKTTDETAHPFVVDKRFAMVHNGTLYQHKKIADTEVDSEALAILLERTLNDTLYEKEMLEAALGDVDGAYACAWYNQVTNKVQFIRNAQRPLVICETKEAFFFGSEAGMLTWCCQRNGLDVVSVKTVAEHELHSYEFLQPDTATTTEVLTIKKPIATTPVVATKDDTTEHGKQTVSNTLSKNQFKRVKEILMGETITFDIQDYVDKHNPNHKQEYLVFGTVVEDPSFDQINHCVHAHISVPEQEIYAIEYADAYTFSGKITAMEYNRQNQRADIYVEGVSNSYQTTKEVLDEGSIAIH